MRKLPVPDAPQVYHLRRVLAWIAVDSAVILAAFTAAFLARAITAPLDYSRGIAFIGFVLILALALLSAFGAYRRLWSQTSGNDAAVIVYAVVVQTALTALIDLSLTPRLLPLSVVLLGNALALSGLVAVRFRSRLISGVHWRWRAVWRREFPPRQTRVLIVGAGQAGRSLAWQMRRSFPDGTRYHVVGFVDDDPQKRGLYIEGARVLGDRTAIPHVVDRHGVDLIAVAIHRISGPAFRDILTYCENTPARIKVMPSVYALINDERGSPLLRDVQPEDFLGRQPIGRHASVDLSPVTGKAILVTGAAGSIGSELCRQLITYAPTRLILLDSNESGLHDLLNELQDSAPAGVLAPVLGDVTHRASLLTVFARHRPQVVFHAAAYKHVPMLELFPGEAVRVNIGGTLNVAELARDYRAERFVLISTDKAVNPTSAMGISKRICELMMHSLAAQPGQRTLFTSVRFGNVLGSRGSVVPTFNRQIDAGGPVTITDPQMTRYFMTIPEAVNLVIHAACLTKGDDLFMLRMGEVVRIVELAERMIRMRGLRPYTDIPIVFTGVRPGEKMHEELYDNLETPVETVHPGIIQLINRDDSFKTADFIDQLKALLDASRPDYKADTLDRFFVIARARQHRPNREPVAAPITPVAAAGC